jgi:hypothetical protein
VETVLLGVGVALIAVFRLRLLEQRSDEQRAVAEDAERQMRELAASGSDPGGRTEEPVTGAARPCRTSSTALRMELGRIERLRAVVMHR